MIPEHIVDPAERANCGALGGILSLIGDKWTIVIVGTLSSGPKRFNELKRLSGGITQRMLTLSLRRLEREGIVSRTVFPTVPPRVDYALTPHGQTLTEPLKALADWAKHHYESGAATASESIENGNE
ncbi:helix-turn-helix domain-containing protein [Saccharibacillus sp. CPCC 101409]|uniref:winged helix-turn-helix transcriptional regulator n=1 Tax=Saccharibacillus sp. CPCC 101409 TaxID=3058041 RepID=UPI0026715904|nr:helix-turn-helix domain-containing protein [Saccharibacillus sp. CPCC 101409]MDO3408323.1 helix-turn-helix domain-containing protein [Saccharibacillus sp. CPCC 101409]